MKSTNPHNKIIAYKLLTQDMTSHIHTQWSLGKTITLPKHPDPEHIYPMCSEEVLHSYSDTILAVIMNPVHADIQNPRLFKILVDKIIATDGLKQASLSQTIVEEIKLPEVSLTTKTAFAILCALEVYDNPRFVTWANKWISGENRTCDSAAVVYAATSDYASDYASAASADAYTAYTASAAYAAASAAYAAASAASAAYAAAYAASKSINFLQLMQKAMEII